MAVHELTDHPAQQHLLTARLACRAMQQAGISSVDVDYVNAHATSTQAGDLAEYRALRGAIPGDHVRINSTKSMIGHLLGAAGAVEAVAAVQAIRTGELERRWGSFLKQSCRLLCSQFAPTAAFKCARSWQLEKILPASCIAASLSVCAAPVCTDGHRTESPASCCAPQAAACAGMLHPNINLTDPEDEIDLNVIVGDTKTPHNVDVALSNSFGFGGHNSSIIFSKM